MHAAREQLSEALVDFVHTASGPCRLEPEPAPAAPARGGRRLDEDDEMREVFLEEAREVLAARTARAGRLWRTSRPTWSSSTTLRRAFHTLKGSSRMVGLREFGAAAWACEQVYNTRLAEQRPADAPLLEFTATALAELGRWVDAHRARREPSTASGVARCRPPPRR